MEIIKNIATILGCVISLITLLTLTTKGGRNLIVKIFKKHTKELTETNEKQNKTIEEMKSSLDAILLNFDVLKEVSRQQCRDTIKNIYYKYQSAKKIPLYERKTVDKTYELYHGRLEGNSYVDLLYKEIIKWEIDGLAGHDFVEEE